MPAPADPQTASEQATSRVSLVTALGHCACLDPSGLRPQFAAELRVILRNPLVRTTAVGVGRRAAENVVCPWIDNEDPVASALRIVTIRACASARSATRRGTSTRIV